MRTSSENTEVLCLPTNPRQYVLHVSDNTLQQLEKFTHLVLVAYLPVTDGEASILIHRLAKITQFYVSLVALWSQNGSFQTPQSYHF